MISRLRTYYNFDKKNSKIKEHSSSYNVKCVITQPQTVQNNTIVGAYKYMNPSCRFRNLVWNGKQNGVAISHAAMRTASVAGFHKAADQTWVLHCK